MAASNQVLGTDKALRINDFPLVGLVQTADFAPQFNAQQINEMGNASRVDQSFELETSGSFQLMSSGNTPGLLARMIPLRDGTSKFTGYQYVPGTSKNAYTVTHTDLKEAQFDIVMHEKPDQVNYTRSVWVPRAYLTRISGSATANGSANETFQWAGQFSESFKTPFHDIRSAPCTVAVSGLEIDLIDGSITSATHTLAYAMVNERVFTTLVTDATYATLDATGKITFTTTEGYTVPSDAICRALVYKTVPGTTFPTLLATDRGTTAFSVRGYNANIYIAPANAATPADSEKWLRIQSMTWDIDLRVETLRQIALNAQGTSIYCRVPTYPIAITSQISVIESDWNDWKQLMTKTFTGTSVYDNSYTFAPVTMKQNFAIVVEYFNKSSVKLQHLVFNDMFIDGAGRRVSVGGRGEVSWSAQGSSFTMTGYDA